MIGYAAGANRLPWMLFVKARGTEDEDTRRLT